MAAEPLLLDGKKGMEHFIDEKMKVLLEVSGFDVDGGVMTMIQYT